jgi:hypothetical protein
MEYRFSPVFDQIGLVKGMPTLLGKGKKDVHAIGAHILIIPQQDGITRLILILLLRR